MKTKHSYIYLCKPQLKASYYLVRFRNNKGQYIQATFGNSTNLDEALRRAVIWRDKNLPPNRKINSRNLLIKPLRNKSTDLPAGITLCSYTKKLKSRLHRYRYFMITAGCDADNKIILKRVHITRNRNYIQALRIAKMLRKDLAAEYGKKFIDKKPDNSLRL